MLEPKTLEKEIDFLCKSQDQQPSEFVILDFSLPYNQRLLCKFCGDQRQPTPKIINFQYLRKGFDEQQREWIQQHESLIRLHIESVVRLENILLNLNERQIQSCDNLLLILKDWITALIDSVTSYSFFKQLDSLLLLQLLDQDQSKLIIKIMKIHSNFQAQFDLDEIRDLQEFNLIQEIFQYQNNLIATQTVELQSSFIIERPKSQFLYQLVQSIRNIKEKEERYVIEDIICPFGIFYRYKKQFYITKDNSEVKYLTQEGQILRIDDITSKNQQTEVLKKWEQIVKLQWKGQYDKNRVKVGEWTATWQGEIIKDVGGTYNNFGEKQGLWKDLIKNYWSLAQVYEIGQYQKGLRQGKWMLIYKDQEIGCGEYNQQGEKNGKWLELSNGFCDNSKVTYIGEYNNGKKIGRWDIFFKYQGNNNKIGGGEYDQAGEERKIGQWIDISDGFFEDSQITFHGEYKNGKGIGKWDIMLTWNGKNKIGGGFYDQEGEGHKVGQWVEIYDQFQQNRHITYNGEYKNGKKVGRWDIWFNYIGKNNKMYIFYSFIQKFKNFRGGGSYDEEGSELKIGQWLELSDGFCDYSQVTYNGEYKIGKKVGRWKAWFNQEGKNIKIGCGLYDEGGEGIKIGQWIDVHDQYIKCRQVAYYGEYRIGKKVGRWEIRFEDYEIGGGWYDQTGEGLKNGQWIDISDGFYQESQVTFHGEYQNGKKIGRWDIWYNKNENNTKMYQISLINNKNTLKFSGGGSYDEVGQGVKIGQWFEICDGFDNYYEVVYNGEYQNGIKVGTWMEIFLGFNQIKEIQYDN